MRGSSSWWVWINHYGKPAERRIRVAALFCLLCAATHADTMDPNEQLRMQGEMARYGICAAYGCPGSGGGVAIGYDPCFLAQNAMRPCNSGQQHSSKPVGVDPNLVDTWELPLRGSLWVLAISPDGTYEFHVEGGSAARSQGKFAANNGRWSLKTAAGYTDGGDYLFQAPDTWIVTGKLGAAAWRHSASLDATRRCVSEQHETSGTGAVDPDIVGVWELPLKSGGLWKWEILRDGTYKFHSEAGDGAPAHAGKFSARKNHWSLKATTGYTDKGLYLYQAPDILLATGNLGGAAWRRPVASSSSCEKK